MKKKLLSIMLSAAMLFTGVMPVSAAQQEPSGSGYKYDIVCTASGRNISVGDLSTLKAGDKVDIVLNLYKDDESEEFAVTGADYAFYIKGLNTDSTVIKNVWYEGMTLPAAGASTRFDSSDVDDTSHYFDNMLYSLCWSGSGTKTYTLSNPVKLGEFEFTVTKDYSAEVLLKYITVIEPPYKEIDLDMDKDTHCKHENTSVSYEKITGEDGSADQTGHSKITKCTDCGNTLSTEKEDHSFSAGKCQKCGAVQKVTMTLDPAGGSIAAASAQSSYDYGTKVTLPGADTVSREGYALKGWTCEGQEGVLAAGSEYEIKADTRFTAVWTCSHTLGSRTEYEKKDDSLHTVKEYCTECGQLIRETTQEHAFDNPEKPGFCSKCDESMKVYLSLDANGGKVNGLDNASVKYSYGDRITLPEPERSGYTFTGWYDDAGNQVNSGSVITADTLYIAMWKCNHVNTVISCRPADTESSESQSVHDVIKTCTDCGETVSVEQAPHNFVNGVCSDCGFVCSHENTVSAEVILENSAVIISICTDCGQQADKAVYEMTEGWDAELNLPDSVITLDPAEGSAGTDDISGIYDQGIKLLLPAASRSSYTFAGWSDGQNTYGASAEYPVTGDAELTAQWNAVSSGSRRSSGSSGNSTTITDTQTPTAENPTVISDDNPPLSGSIKGQVGIKYNDDGSYILLPKSIVKGTTPYTLYDPSVYKISILDNAKDFTDVNDSDWFAEYVDFASSHELYNGVKTGVFAPNTPMSRAMLATVLYRLEEPENTSAANPFSDVLSDYWYTDGIDWASEDKVILGYGNGCFGPDDSITREQLAAMLYRYAESIGMDTSASQSLSEYTDGNQTSAWAQDAMKWANGSGIVNGKGNGILDPKGNATRAEVAAMVERLVAILVNA